MFGSLPEDIPDPKDPQLHSTCMVVAPWPGCKGHVQIAAITIPVLLARLLDNKPAQVHACLEALQSEVELARSLCAQEQVDSSVGAQQSQLQCVEQILVKGKQMQADLAKIIRHQA